MQDTYFNEQGVLCCDECEQDVNECACACGDCGDLLLDCPCDDTMGGAE